MYDVESPQPCRGSASGDQAKGSNHSVEQHGEDERVLARWLEALRRESPNLPPPIAVAMTEGALRGPLGQSLCRLEVGLMEIEDTSLEHLTGSEVRVITAILHALTDAAARLEREIAHLYTAQTH